MTREETILALQLYERQMVGKTTSLYLAVSDTLKELIFDESTYTEASAELAAAYTKALKEENFFAYFKASTVKLISDVSYNQAVLNISVSSKAEYTAKIPRISLFDDNITLSRRIRSNYIEVVKAQREVLDKGLRAGRGVVSVAEDINKVGGFAPEIPGYIKDLQNKKIFGQPLSDATIKRVKKQISKIKAPGLKRSYDNLVDAIALDKPLDKAVAKALSKKSLSFANRLARSEAINTQNAVKIARWAENPLTKWVYTKTSGSAPCNFCLTMEAMGPVPFESAPKFIYHPNDSCTMHPVYSREKPEIWTQEEYEKKFVDINEKIGKTSVKTTEVRNLRENTLNDKLLAVA